MNQKLFDKYRSTRWPEKNPEVPGFVSLLSEGPISLLKKHLSDKTELVVEIGSYHGASALSHSEHGKYKVGWKLC